MAFNSWSFVIFFPAVCLIYWLLKGQRARNVFLLAASYYFYMCWNASYGLLLFTSTAISYGTGMLLDGDRRHRKAIVTLGIVLNLSLLAYFKYASFGVETLNWMLATMGITMKVPLPDILLPVGVSFFVFQSIGYTIDCYRRSVPVEHNAVNYALFVSFFPQLVAGPIERSRNMLPQFRTKRTFDDDMALQGLKLMLWGYFLKLVIADRCGGYVAGTFDIAHPVGHSSLIAIVLFTLQIYGDFAGYTYIAIGTARILGYHLNDNFNHPFFSATITEFWRRWHISLSTWFRDYLYFPMGGSRAGKWRTHFNLMVTFLASGLWHGAAWRYVLWGGAHGVMMCVERALGWNKKKFQGLERALRAIVTYMFVAMAFLLYRVGDLNAAWLHIKRSLLPHNFTLGDPATRFSLGILLVAVCIMVAKEAIEEWRPALLHRGKQSIARDCCVVVSMLLLLSFMASPEGGTFVYFQF